MITLIPNQNTLTELLATIELIQSITSKSGLDKIVKELKQKLVNIEKANKTHEDILKNNRECLKKIQKESGELLKQQEIYEEDIFQFRKSSSDFKQELSFKEEREKEFEKELKSFEKEVKLFANYKNKTEFAFKEEKKEITRQKELLYKNIATYEKRVKAIKEAVGE